MAGQSGWVIERYVNNDLRYWCGHRADDFRPVHTEAIRFARQEDANIVLGWLCEGVGRTAEHRWIDNVPAAQTTWTGMLKAHHQET